MARASHRQIPAGSKVAKLTISLDQTSLSMIHNLSRLSGINNVSGTIRYVLQDWSRTNESTAQVTRE